MEEHKTPVMDSEGHITHTELLRIADEILFEILGDVITETTSVNSTDIENAESTNSGSDSGLDSQV